MQQFKLTIFRQSRVLLIVVLFPVSLLTAIIIGAEIEIAVLNFIVPIAFLGLMGLGLFYFTVGHLTIIQNNNKLEFFWTKKILFNYSDIEPVEITQIETLIIDQGQFLRKIITGDREITINNGKILMKDSQKFIDFLMRETQARKIDSWDVWQERGWLGIAFKINTAILIVGFIIVIVYIIVKGFSNKLLLFMPLTISQLLLYQGQMKNKLKDKSRHKFK